MKQKDERRFVSLKIKWAAGTALGSLIIFCIVAMALFSAFTQNLFHQERQLLNQGMTNISTQLSTVDKPLTKKNVSHLIDPDRNRSNIISGEEYKRPVMKELSD